MRLRVHQIDPEAVADGGYAVQVVGDVVTGLVAVATASKVPLTTVVNGVPDFVWDENDELVHTEVPL